MLGRFESGASREAPSRIRLIRVDLLGDVVMSLVGARLIKHRFPKAHLSMVTLPQTAPVARMSPDVDQVIEIDTNRIRSVRAWLRRETYVDLSRAWHDLRRERLDITYSLYGRTASLLSFLGRSRALVGYADEAYPQLLSRAVRHGRWSLRRRQPDTEFTRRLVAEDGELSIEDHAPSLTVTPEARARASGLLGRIGIGNSVFAVFHPGSSYGDAKRWPAQHFAELAVRLEADGIKTVLVGSRAEQSLAAQIENTSPARSLAGHTDIEELAALLSRASVVVSGDSGPLHLATALGIPAVAVYGPTDPSINGPIAWKGQAVTVLRRDLACSPCYSVRVRAGCPLRDPICMRLVSPDEVYSAARAILQGNGAMTGRSSPCTSASP